MLYDFILFICGLAILSVGAHFLVKGAVQLALLMGISTLAIGLTVVSFGTSAPEMVVSLIASAKGEEGIAVGNVIGSNLFNLLVVLGASAAVSPLIVHRQLLRFDVPVMIAASALGYFFARNGVISRWQGALLSALLILYTAIVLLLKDELASQKEKEVLRVEPAKTKGEIFYDGFCVLIGLIGLAWGADWSVKGASAIAESFGFSELFIGLTIVAAGTSLPELAASVAAMLHGERDLAVGNAVGSCTFNILAVLGLSAMVSPLHVAEQALVYDYPIMLAVMLLMIPTLFIGKGAGRRRGIAMIFSYAAYLGFLLFIHRI